MASPMRITRLCSAGVVMSVCLSFLPAIATFLRGGPPGRWPGAPGARQSRPPGPRETRLPRPIRRNSSSRSLISILGTLPSRAPKPGNWINCPVAAEPVTTGCGIFTGTGTVVTDLASTGSSVGSVSASDAASAGTVPAGSSATAGIGSGAAWLSAGAWASTAGANASDSAGADTGGATGGELPPVPEPGGVSGGGAGNGVSTTGAATGRAAGRAGAGRAAPGEAVRDRRRITVSLRRSSTRLSWRSRSIARRTRSASTPSRFDMWLATSTPRVRTLATRSLGAMPNSLASS